MSSKFVDTLNILLLLKSVCPNYLPREQIAEKIGIKNVKKIDPYIKTLKSAGLIDGKPGRSGGLYYNPQKEVNDKTKIDQRLSTLGFDNIEELSKLSFLISDEKLLKRINEITLDGVNLIPNLRIDDFSFSKEDQDKMLILTEAISLHRNVRFTHLKENSYEATVSPICFSLFNGQIYLNANYFKVKDKKVSKESTLKIFLLAKISNIEIIDNSTSQVKKEDFEAIQNRYPYEIFDKDKELNIKIRLFNKGYSVFLRTFKNYGHDLIDFTKEFVDLIIPTKSYYECLRNLLTLGETFEFLDKDNSVFRLYQETIENIADRLSE